MRIGIDLGGTSVKAALCEEDGTLLSKRSTPTRTGDAEGLCADMKLLALALWPLNLGAMAVNVAILQMAMPVAANGSMLAMEYGGDVQTMAKVTFLTTLCSLVTVPVLAGFLLV